MMEAPSWAHLARHRPVRPGHLLAHGLRRAHGADRRLQRRPIVGGLDRPGAGRRQRLFRRLVRPHLPARARRADGLPADHPGAGGGRGVRHRRAQRHHRHHHPAGPALRPRRAGQRARGARGALCRCRARAGLRPCPHRAAPHGAQRDGAVPDPALGLRRPGDPGRGVALLPRASACRSRCRPGA